MVIWLIGLSGAGKTTLAEKVVTKVREAGRQVVMLDGDQVREFFASDLGYSLDDRRKNAERICNICAFLDNQSIDVVCSILSIFSDSRSWCRDNLKQYYEVFIDTPIDILQKRDSKDIYGRYARGEIREVAGLDLDFPRPSSPDMHIINNGSLDELLANASEIADQLLGVDA